MVQFCAAEWLTYRDMLNKTEWSVYQFDPQCTSTPTSLSMIKFLDFSDIIMVQHFMI